MKQPASGSYSLEDAEKNGTGLLALAALRAKTRKVRSPNDEELFVRCVWSDSAGYNMAAICVLADRSHVAC
jgi:hypothetical protein